MNKSILTLLLFSIFFSALGNSKKADSLKYEIINTENIVIKADLQLDYCWEIKYEHFDKCLSNTKEAIQVLTKARNEKGIAKGLSYMGVYLYLQDSIPKAISFLEKAEKMLLTQNNPDLLSRVYNNFGVFYSAMYDNETALLYYQKSLEIKEKQLGEVDISSNLINISSILYDQGKYQECIDINEQALIFTLKNDDLESTAVVYSNLGAANERLGNYNLSINYALKALELYQYKLVNKSAEARTYSNLGANYLSQGKLDEAKYYYELGLELNTINQVQSNLAVSNNNMAEVERRLKNFKSAESYALVALEIASQLNYAEEKRISFEELSRIAEDQNDFKSSLHYHKLYVALSDSIMEGNQSINIQKTIIQNQLSMQKIQDKENIEFTVFKKKRIIMQGFIWALGLFSITWLVVYFLFKKINGYVVICLNYLIPITFSASLTMYVLIETSIPQVYGVFENIILISSIIITGMVLHLLLHKHSTCNILNDRG